MNRITKAALVLVLTGGMLVMSAMLAPASKGFSYFYGGTTPISWNKSPVYWCVAENYYWDGSFDWISPMRSAVTHWNSNMNSLLIWESGSSSCDIEVRIVNFSWRGWPNNPARATIGTSGTTITSADLYINAERTNEFWFSTKHHYCTVVCPSRPLDLYTIFSHELGHTIGLGHNKAGVSCSAGYDTEQTAAACTNDFYSVDIMYAYAADGYRRWITTDTRNGLVALGYRNP